MASWTTTFGGNANYTLTMTVSEQSYSIANNTSVVKYTVTMATKANSYVGYSNYRTQVSFTIDGTTVYSYDASRDFNPSAASSYSEVLCTGTKTITHSADGTKSISLQTNVSVASGQYSPGSASLSGSLTLTTIPRASTLATPISATITQTTRLNITAADASFKHKIKTAFGSVSLYVNSGNYITASYYDWTPSKSTWASEFPTQTSRSGTITLETYTSGGTLIGSNSYSATLAIPSSWVPTVAVTVSPSQNPAKAWLTGKTFYVSGYTKMAAALTATLSDNGTSVKNFTITGAFTKSVNTSSTTTTQTSDYITTSATSNVTKSITVTVTDARGRTGTATASVTYLPYAAPSVTSLTYARGSYVGGVWTSSDSGTDLRVVFKATCKLTSQSNNLATWSIGSPVSTSGTNLSSGTSITRYKTSIGTTTRYNVKVTVTDQLGNSASRTITVPTVEIPFVIDTAKPAVGVGAVPQTAQSLEVATGWKITQAGNDVLTKADMELFGFSSTISANGTKTLTLANMTRFVLFTSANSANSKGMYIVHTTSGGGVSTAAVLAASNITLTTATNSLTISNSTSAVIYYGILLFGGSIS